ncbi:processed acidic surface protein [Bacillus sp. FJAT-29814]|uniref:processed acidic surface protein n=1 Tax=Bacillus sp. FJAT-29814 TaxID=1729688 RepID=UPI000834110E|nr:processed acidic surface protein [Bacillus sp. FJAT-29814]
MGLKKASGLLLISAMLLVNVPLAFAAPPEQELTQYLREIGWTKQELQEYLDFYEFPLDEFASIDELREFLGTPITAENLQELLTKYNMTQQDVKNLLDHFGDSLAEYKFIEDLETALDFYVNHDEYMADIEKELNEIGITEDESERFFEYLAQVEEKNKFQLDQMGLFDSRIEKFLEIDDTSELSEEDRDELEEILTETIDLYEIQVKFKVNNQDISLRDLMKLKEAPNNLNVEVTSKAGAPLIDFIVPKWFFKSGDLVDQGENMIHLGEISNEYIDHLHDEKEKKADFRYK